VSFPVGVLLSHHHVAAMTVPASHGMCKCGVTGCEAYTCAVLGVQV
jgi:hypothetical protein